MRMFIKILAVGIVLSIAVSLCDCGSGSEQLPVPPPPVLEQETDTSEPEQTEASDLIVEETEEQEPVEGFVVTYDSADNCFPDKITFTLEGSSDSNIENIILKYGSDKHTLVNEVNSAEPDFTGGKEIDISWDWEMKKTGSLPPGARIWWRWELTDNEGITTRTDKQTITYSDTRFQWQTSHLNEIVIYWNGQSESLKRELTSELETKLSRIELDVSIPEERKIQVFVYKDSEELRGAILHEQEWVGAVAFTEYNIILTAVNQDSLEWAKGALPHEITHLLVNEVIFGPFGDIPTWLNEGISVYSEGELSDYRYQYLKSAYEDDELISVRSLSGSFPTDPYQARLAYAESGSIVTYLLEEYGWEQMRLLLEVFKEGSTYDGALQKVYGFDMDRLESEWMDYLADYF